MRSFLRTVSAIAILISWTSCPAFALSDAYKENIYNPGQLKPVDSTLKVREGEPAPEFTLPSLSGETFVPAAWTPICSDQWPGYNLAKGLFEAQDAVLLGITVDNLPTLYSWTRQMGNLWFPVLSDFWPHGAVADKFGVLRSDGIAERALFIIDKAGILRYAKVGDINRRPDLEELINAMEKTNSKR
ncbi:MAG: redoxin domain-containing protein [Deltaproteobacteria bacterium]|nr:redoxin domain-containing protein [Deltaproteobacteria bacterium]